jgi:hypothetical protein
MNKVEYIVIIKFLTKSEGLVYLGDNNLEFSFKTKSNKFYDHLGNIVTAPDNYEEYEFGKISICDNIDPLPGELYTENGFLKYYKEEI